MSSCALFCLSTLLVFTSLKAKNSRFHDAPATTKQLKNPYVAQRDAAEAGGRTYANDCVGCHGQSGKGGGNVPSLVNETIRTASDGELFWFITEGDVNSGMPSWAGLPEPQRWGLVSYLKSGLLGAAAQHSSPTPDAGVVGAPPPKAPFTDFRFEKPGSVRKITLQDLPAPFGTNSARNSAQLVARPPNAWPKAPSGFKVDQYATGLTGPRLIHTAPNGDYS